jgi:hypothetical protein
MRKCIRRNQRNHHSGHIAPDSECAQGVDVECTRDASGDDCAVSAGTGQGVFSGCSGDQGSEQGECAE